MSKPIDKPANKSDEEVDTSTTEFELEGMDEVAASATKRITRPKQAWKPLELPKLEIERPPELQREKEAEPKVWIFERRARGLLADLRRWFGNNKSNKR